MPLQGKAGRVRVLQFIPDFGVGGAELMVVNLMTHLDRARFEVQSVSFFARRENRLEAMLEASGLPVRYLGKGLGFDPSLFWRLQREIRRFAPHVLHSHLAVLPYALPAYLLNPGPVAFHTLHSPAEWEADRAGKAAGRLLFGRRVRPIAVAESVRESVRRVYGVDAAVIMNGIDLEPIRAAAEQRCAWRRDNGLSPDDFVFVCVARLMPEKNHTALLTAFSDVVRARSTARLLLVGDGALKANLVARTAVLGLAGKVKFLGIRDDVPAVLAASDAFVLASEFEGNPLSIMEALAAGRPVVATDVGGVADLVNHEVNGLLVPRSDASTLAAAMLRLMVDPALTARLRTAAADRTERFGADTMARAYEGQYLRALAGRGAGKGPTSTLQE